jgi:hypothetical protein
MKSRAQFLQALTSFRLSHDGRAIALLWFYRQTQEFDERSASDLASDLHDEGFPKPHVTRLHDSLRRSKFVVKGKRSGTFQLDARRLKDLDERYRDILEIRQVDVTDAILPATWFAGTRAYLERMVYQINGSYDYGLFDCCAVLCRRLMESLLIEIYVGQKRHAEIQHNGMFLPLERLISHIRQDGTVVLARNSPKVMDEIKHLGDTAAHDRVYITEQMDVDNVKAPYRKLVRELGELAGILK